VTGKVIGLIPFMSVELGAAKAESPSCLLMRETSTRESPRAAMLKWNVGSRRFPQAASWLPTEVVFVPVELWRVELRSRDPYSLYGRQVLYVDTELMLPVYKFVYDRAGRHWKTVMSVFGMAESEDKERYPFTSLMVIDDLKAGDSFLLDYLNIRYCNEFPEGTSLASLDPSKLGGPPPTVDTAAEEVDGEGKEEDEAEG